MSYASETIEYASFKERFLAFLIDFLIISLGIILVFVIWIVLSFTILSFGEGYLTNHPNIDTYISLLLIGILFLVFILWQSSFRRTGQTLDARIMKIKLVSSTGGKLGIFVPIFWLVLCAPYFAIFASYTVGLEGKQSIFDIIFRTYTIKV